MTDAVFEIKGLSRRFIPMATLARPWTFSVLLFVVLLICNLIVLPAFLAASNLAATLAVGAPWVLAAMAATPSILSGGGGIDISIGPLIGFVNVFIIGVLVAHGLANPAIVIPVVIAIGIFVGAVNGILVAYIRVQPIVATLGMYLLLVGLALVVLPQPGGTAPTWLIHLAGSFGPVPGSLLLIVPAIGMWIAIRKLPFHRALLGTGSDDRAAFTAGVNTELVRVCAYALGGFFAALAGIALTALVQSGDPTLGAPFTLVAISAAVLGGTSVAGGVGGMAGSIVAALDIYLIQELLSAAHVPSSWIQVMYGAILLISLAINSAIRTFGRKTR